MNPLTLVKRIQQINSKEAALGISDDASWHAKYKESAYVFVGGIPYDLTEGDLLAVFAQYGEIVDVNLVRDKATGKSKGFCFVAYEDQRSTNLAVDNLNGANVLGRIIRVDHVTKYKKKEEEDEEVEQQKREERGVCRAFQRGDCNRGASCKFSHNEQVSHYDLAYSHHVIAKYRELRTRVGVIRKIAVQDGEKDKYDGSSKGPKSTGNISSDRHAEPKGGFSRFRSDDKNGRLPRSEENEGKKNIFEKQIETKPRDQDRRSNDKRSERYEKETNHKDLDRRRTERSSRHDSELNLKEDRDDRGRQENSGRRDSEPSYKGDRENRKEERLGRHESERYQKEDRHHREDEKRPRYDRDSSYHHRREETDTSQRRSHR